MLDFLKELVEAVPDPSAGGTIDVEYEKAEARKRKAGGRKKKKKGGEDDDEGDHDDARAMIGIKDEETEGTDNETQTGRDDVAGWDDDDGDDEDDHHKRRKPR